jgi:ribose transport system permease protein
MTSRRATAGVLSWIQHNGLFVAFALCFIGFSVLNSRFLTIPNLTVILLTVSLIAIMAVPMAMIVTAGYVDLSVGSMAVLAATVYGEAANLGVPMVGGLMAAFFVAVLWGLLQGFLTTRLGFAPIVVTLGGLAALRGIAQLVGAGRTKFGFGDAFQWLGGGTVILPVPVWIAIAFFVVGFVVWYLMPHGRWFMAIGSDSAVARSMGVQVRGIPFALYIATSVAAAVSGLLLASQLDSSSISIGQGWELSVLTAVLLGGVSFTGGSGSLFGVLIGVLFIGVLDNGLIIIGAGPYWHGIAIGVALIFAAALDVASKQLARVQIAEVAAPSGPTGSDQGTTAEPGPGAKA